MIRILTFILAGMIVPVSIFAEFIPFSAPSTPSGPKIRLFTVTDKDPVYSGGRFKLYLSALIGEGWHIYSLQPLDGNELLATQIILEDNIFESQEHWQESPTRLIQDEAQEKLVKGHVSTAEFHNSFRVPKNAKPGNHSINGELFYRACDNNICTLPQSLPFASQIHVGGIK